jgi:nucleoside-diphosphate-sugar epimerase
MLDVSKAKKEFGFKATIAFDDGLRRTISWYRTHSTALSCLS